MNRCSNSIYGNIIRLEETDSTNNHLRRLLENEEVPEFTVVTAGHQHAGKGQRGNTWESEKQQNLLFSVLLKPEFIPVTEQFILSQLISLAIKEELSIYANDISIKWPNDIYYRDKKIGGILIENSLQGEIITESIIGIGINMNQKIFSANVPNPVSLALITNREHDRNTLLVAILKKLDYFYQKLKEENNTHYLRSYYHSSLYRLNEEMTFADKTGEFRATITAVEPSGMLILTDSSGIHRKYYFKEVQFIR